MYDTTDSTVTSTKVVNDSSASITRDYQDVEAHATGTLQTTDIYWDTTDSCSDGGSPSNPDEPSQ